MLFTLLKFQVILIAEFVPLQSLKTEKKNLCFWQNQWIHNSELVPEMKASIWGEQTILSSLP